MLHTINYYISIAADWFIVYFGVLVSIYTIVSLIKAFRFYSSGDAVINEEMTSKGSDVPGRAELTSSDAEAIERRNNLGGDE